MSNGDWFDDDQEEKVDLRLWKKLLQYTLHYRRTAVTFCFVAFGLAASDLCFPLLTGRLIADVATDGTRVVAGATGVPVIGLSIFGQGAAYVFEDQGSGWVETQRVTPNDPGNSDHFGFSNGNAGRINFVGHLFRYPYAGNLISPLSQTPASEQSDSSLW